MYPFGESVLIEAAVDGAEDSHGNTVPGFASAVTVEGCAFSPGSTVETFDNGRNAVVTSPQLFCPAGTVVSSRSRVTVRGLVYVVDGDPADWVNPYTGSNPGIAVNLERVDG